MPGVSKQRTRARGAGTRVCSGQGAQGRRSPWQGNTRTCCRPSCGPVYACCPRSNQYCRWPSKDDVVENSLPLEPLAHQPCLSFPSCCAPPPPCPYSLFSTACALHVLVLLLGSVSRSVGSRSHPTLVAEAGFYNCLLQDRHFQWPLRDVCRPSASSDCSALSFPRPHPPHTPFFLILSTTRPVMRRACSPSAWTRPRPLSWKGLCATYPTSAQRKRPRRGGGRQLLTAGGAVRQWGLHGVSRVASWPDAHSLLDAWETVWINRQAA